MNKLPLIVITGPTASGKTKLAVEVALKCGGEIISADSRQVYRGMNIGTGKDISIYTRNNEQVPYHLIDMVDPSEYYTINHFYKDYQEVMIGIRERETQPILCGGSGLYIETILKGNKYAAVPVNKILREQLNELNIMQLKQAIANEKDLPFPVDTNSRKRMMRALEIVAYLKDHSIPRREGTEDYLLYVLFLERGALHENISWRLRNRLDAGMIDEVETLLSSGISAERLNYFGLEYRWVTRYILGEIKLDVMKTRLETAIRQYAKRQMTWLRRMERQGMKLLWLEGNNNITELAEKILNGSKNSSRLNYR